MAWPFATNSAILIEAEASFGNDAVANKILDDDSNRNDGDIVGYWQDVSDIEITNEGEISEPSRLRPTHSGVPHQLIKQRTSVSMTMPLLAGVSSDPNTPRYNDVLTAMNLKENTVNNNTVYSPHTQFQNAITIYEYKPQVEGNEEWLRVIRGVVGSGSFSFELESEAQFEFEGAGYWEDASANGAGSWYKSRDYIETDKTSELGNVNKRKDGTDIDSSDTGGTDPAVIEFLNQDPMVVEGMTFTHNSKDYDIDSVSFDLNWSTDEQAAITGTAGQRRRYNARGDDSRIEGSFNLIDATDSNFQDLLTEYSRSNEQELKISLDDPAGNRTIEIIFPNVQLAIPDWGENNNLLSAEFGFMANGDWSSQSVGNDEFTLTYS